MLSLRGGTMTRKGINRTKLHRCILIHKHLLDKGSITVRSIQNDYHVSGRTAQRDLNDLCMCDVPLTSGEGGRGNIWRMMK